MIGAVFPSRRQQRYTIGAVFPSHWQQRYMIRAVFPSHWQQRYMIRVVFPSHWQQRYMIRAVFPSLRQQRYTIGAVFPFHWQQRYMIRVVRVSIPLTTKVYDTCCVSIPQTTKMIRFLVPGSNKLGTIALFFKLFILFIPETIKVMLPKCFHPTTKMTGPTWFHPTYNKDDGLRDFNRQTTKVLRFPIPQTTYVTKVARFSIPHRHKKGRRICIWQTTKVMKIANRKQNWLLSFAPQNMP